MSAHACAFSSSTTSRNWPRVWRRCWLCSAIAGDEEDALARARAHAFDLAFVDSRVPTMHGSDLFFEIRRVMPTARVVMMTGFREPILDRALQAGAEGTLLKPFSIKDMLQTIETAP
jgi:DNA-binding NarL/FixJ family response regulator